jgi:hypothetical protein
MSSTFKRAAVVVGELNQTNEGSDVGKEGFQYTKARSRKLIKVKIARGDDGSRN